MCSQQSKIFTVHSIPFSTYNAQKILAIESSAATADSMFSMQMCYYLGTLHVKATIKFGDRLIHVHCIMRLIIIELTTANYLISH